MKKFKILSRETLINSHFCPIEKHLVELPNGKLSEWFVNISKAAVIVIPILSSGEVLLQKAYKHGSREIITEFCAGMIDEGETPIQAAKRELSEETGYASSQWEKIGEVFANPTGSEMKYHFFLAGNCNQMKSPQQDEAEQIETFLVKSFEKARELLTNPKTITSSATMAALVFAEGSVRKKKI